MLLRWVLSRDRGRTPRGGGTDVWTRLGEWSCSVASSSRPSCTRHCRWLFKGDHQVVVVAGDAGVGKTTLINDMARRAEDFGFTVAVGHCVDIEAQISFGPVVEALFAMLLAKVEDVELAAGSTADARVPGPGDAGQGGAARPARGPPSSCSWRPPTRGRFCWCWRTCTGPTPPPGIWPSRCLGPARGRLLLVVSVRTDDLHRRDPARKVLAEIARVPGGRRVDLGGLDRASIAGIVASVSRDLPGPGRGAGGAGAFRGEPAVRRGDRRCRTWSDARPAE